MRVRRKLQGPGPIQIDRDRSTPLWAQVRADLERRLSLDEFDGDFPGELELTAQYAVSRHTIREALRHLRSEGVVVGARGRRSRLAAPDYTEIEQPLGALYSLFASVEAAGLEQRSIVRALDLRADAVIADRLDLDGSVPLLYLERLRLADDEPFAMDRVWLPASIAEPLLAADFTHTALYDELDARCDFRLTSGREHIRAVIPTSADRKLLEIDDTTALFAIERLGERAGRPMEWRHTLVRGDRLTLTADFTADTGYRLELAGPQRRTDLVTASKGRTDVSAHHPRTIGGRGQPRRGEGAR
jgi:GntR family transcriptional regulator